MVKHIICFRLKDSAEGNSKSENAKLIKKKLLGLKDKIKEIKFIEVGINDVKASRDNFDLVLISGFESFADLEIYQKHPEHIKTAELIARLRETRACVDFEE